MFRTTIVISFAALAALPACVSQNIHRRVLAANVQLQEERDDLSRHVRELSELNQSLSSENQRLGRNATDAAWLAAEKEKLAQIIASLGGATGGTGGMPGDLDIAGVSVRQGADGVVVQVQGEVLFASGRAELSATGRRTLDQIVPTLRREATRLRVDGHTDSDPIVHSEWKTNLRLSCARANSVADHLISSGLPADRMSVAGFGEHRPIASSDDETAKQANRRVEIVLLDN